MSLHGMHWHICMDLLWYKRDLYFIMLSLFVCLTHSVSLSFSANHRRAGHAVTNILAKELMQEDAPSSSKTPAKKKKSEEKEEPKIEGAESLEELLEATPTRSN